MGMNWLKGFSLEVLNKEAQPDMWLQRRLSDMDGYYMDKAYTAARIAEDDPLIYEYQEFGAPEDSGDLAFGITRLFPGKIGEEYFMTKGHFHNITDTAEVYLCLSGHGVLITESESGEASNISLSPMTAGYVAKGFAHRVANTGREPLVFFFVFRADAGHRYGTIREKGFQTRVIEKNSGAECILIKPQGEAPEQN